MTANMMPHHSSNITIIWVRKEKMAPKSDNGDQK